MFWSSPSADIKIMVFLLVVSLIIAVATYIFSKRMKLLISISVLSILSNLSIYLNSGSMVFDIYDIKYIVSFTLHIWPYINAALFVLLVLNIIKNRRLNVEK